MRLSHAAIAATVKVTAARAPGFSLLGSRSPRCQYQCEAHNYCSHDVASEKQSSEHALLTRTPSPEQATAPDLERIIVRVVPGTTLPFVSARNPYVSFLSVGLFDLGL